MKLRTCLLISFSSVVLLVLIVFGYIAYHIAIDSVFEAEFFQLQKYIDSRLSPLNLESGKVPSLKQIGNLIHKSGTDNKFTSLVIDEKRNIILPQKINKEVSKYIDSVPNKKIFARKKNKNRFSLEDQVMLWASRTIGNSGYRLIVFTKSNHAQIAPLSNLISRLSVAMIGILWVSIWIALIVSTTISRRLKAHTLALEHQTLHNDLTKLPNRTMLFRKLNTAIERAKNENKCAALIILDLDRFKDINDTLGHRFGDMLVCEVGKRLTTELWTNDTIAHLGGDSFAVLITIRDISHSASVITKLLDIIASTYTVESMTINVDASLGIAAYPQHGHDASTIYRCAEIAMYSAKENGEDFSYYDSSRDPFSIKRLKLMGDLKHAAERDELELYYQPKVRMNDGKVLGVEALLRWHHPQHGMILPDEFIPLSEQTGIINSITEWVLGTAISQCKEWKNSGLDLSIAVNLSPRVLHDVHLPTKVASKLKNYDLDPNSLILEITETAVMIDPIRALDVLLRFHSMGVRLSIDDFGTGYTSMSYLHQLPINEIKIDKSFVMDLLENPNDAVIVRSIIDLALNMGLQVVAEGIEDDATYRELIRHHCDHAQGYYISQPLPLDEFYMWLSNKEHDYKKSFINNNNSVSKFRRKTK